MKKKKKKKDTHEVGNMNVLPVHGDSNMNMLPAHDDSNGDATQYEASNK
jgi:hypothetical protein